MSTQATIDRANRAKADFGAIYNAPDPRAYFATLSELEYQIPANARPSLRRMIAHLRESTGRERVTILDVGCSFGINAALLKFDLDLDDLCHRCVRHAAAALDAEALIERNRTYFGAAPHAHGLRMVGLDVADRATDYAVRTGLLDAAVTTNLEQTEPTPTDTLQLRRVDAIISTGCVGYVTERTFERILRTRVGTPPPWIASFVLRMFPYDAIAGTLARHGLRTVKLEGQTFVQRRFEDDEERAGVVHGLRARGMEVDGLEDTGYLHAELFLSCPPNVAMRPPDGRRWTVVDAP